MSYLKSVARDMRMYAFDHPINRPAEKMNAGEMDPYIRHIDLEDQEILAEMTFSEVDEMELLTLSLADLNQSKALSESMLSELQDAFVVPGETATRVPAGMLHAQIPEDKRAILYLYLIESPVPPEECKTTHALRKLAKEMRAAARAQTLDPLAAGAHRVVKDSRRTFVLDEQRIGLELSFTHVLDGRLEMKFLILSCHVDSECARLSDDTIRVITSAFTFGRETWSETVYEERAAFARSLGAPVPARTVRLFSVHDPEENP